MNECCKKTCDKSVCGCPEPVLSIEAMPDNPSILRFNVNGKSVWYDFSPVVRVSETATTLSVDGTKRTLNYQGEKSSQSFAAPELGSILHVADLGDVDETSIKDFGILNYRTDADCGDGCTSVTDMWEATNPIDVGGDSLIYILGSDVAGKLSSLMPPSTANKFAYLAWTAQNKAAWKVPTEVSVIPTDVDQNQYPLYLDPNTGEIVVYKQRVVQ